MVDIHSHILPAVDDGAKDLEESIALLETMQAQGITHVFATPHFYPQTDSDFRFRKEISAAYKALLNAVKDKDLPQVHLGCELLYFNNIGISDSIEQFCFKGSRYLLLELTDGVITDSLFEDLLLLKNESKITPIIAHIERYCYAKKFKQLIKFIKEHKIPTQINASSLFVKPYQKAIKKLIKADVVTFIATDAHSIDERPPMLLEALELLTKKYSADYTVKLQTNSLEFFKEIISGEKSD